MTLKDIIFISLTTSILITGCGSESASTGSNTSTPIITASNSLKGTWKDTSNGRVNVYSDTTYTSHFAKTYTSLGYSFDATSYWTYTEKGTKLIQPNDRNATKVDINRTSCLVYMTPITVQTVSDFNNASECSFSDWSLNVQKDVSNCSNTLVQASCVASNSKNIYFIEDNKLYVGYAQYPDADGYSDVLRLDYMIRQ